MGEAASKTVFLVVEADAERLLRLGLWAVSAASMGGAVDVLLCAPALRAWREGRFDAQSEAAAALGLPSPRGLLEQARLLAPVRLLTCSTELLLAGADPERAPEGLDGRVALPSFWKETEAARTLVL